MGVEIGRPYSWYQPKEEKPICWETPYEEQAPKPEKISVAMEFEILPEPNDEVDFSGFCQCDYCKAHPKEAVRLCKGKTVFFIEGKSIYCDCLEEYLKARMMVLS